MEVIYTGLRQTPAQIAAAAVQEDVDAIGLSCLSGAHNEIFPEIVQLLKEKDAEDIIVIGGGVIPWEDIPFLESKGIQKIFTPGTPTLETAKFIEQAVYERDGIEIEEEITDGSPEKIDHIGIAVSSLDKALPFYVSQLKLTLEGVEEVPSEGVKVAFLKIGDTRFELLEPLSDDGPIAAFLEKRGEGIHHVALGVKDIAERVSELKQNGINMLNDEPKDGADGAEVTFIHPKSAHGVLYELYEKKEDV